MTAPVVAGVDGTPQSLRAVAWAAAAAARRHAPLRVVNAFGIPDAFTGETIPPQDWLGARRRESEAVVREAVEVAGKQPELVTERESTAEAPIPLLLRLSEDARLMVVGSAGRGVLGDLLIGSAALALTARARCPVAVIRGGERGGEAPVVAGVDGGPGSDLVLELAFEEASVHTAPLMAVHVPAGPESTRVFTGLLAGWQEKYPEVVVRQAIEQDKARERLLEWSTRARTIVVGSRGRGGFTGLLLGSTSQALVEHASCPVLIARH